LCWLRLTRKKFRAATALLHDALELPDKVRDIIASPLNTTYVARCNGHIVAAVVVRWGIESEIELLAVDPDRLFKGIGQAVIGQVLELARVRKIHRLVVGTGNSSLLNITFYQKCGFRLSHIRHNYFSEHYPELLSEERGVKITDMIVFAYSL
jgi:ribosomal protein S18 acetylase RimI-like enzyme